jgi:sugar (pentulose or hexulose) kinase
MLHMPEAVLGIDAGTGSLKSGLFRLDGSPLAMSRAAYTISSPEPDAREQDPMAVWTALVTTCREVLGLAPSGTQVLAMTVGGQAPSLVPVDADLQPTHPAITWLDPRPAAEAERLYARLGQPVPVWGSWPAQCAWFTRNRPDAMRRTRWFLGCPDYLTSRLMCRATALLPVSDAELSAGDLDPSRFPPAWTPGTVTGELNASVAADLHLPPGTPVVGGHVDGLLGVLGSGVSTPRDACINAGTSGTFSVVCEPPLGYPMFGVNVAGTAANTSGAALDWFIRNIYPGDHADAAYADVLACVSSIPAGSNGLLFLPHLAGERGATADAHARGAWVGLTLGHDRHHLLRALLEGVAFSFRSMQDWLEHSGAQVADVRCVGGQAHSDLWNQIKSDVLNRPLLVPEVHEAAVAGAAVLAAFGISAYADIWEAARNMVHIHRRFDPDPERVTLYADLLALYRSLYPALRETNWRLHDLNVHRHR